MGDMNRRKFIEFLGYGTLGATVIPMTLASCGTEETESSIKPKQRAIKTEFENPFQGIEPSFADRVLLEEGLYYSVLLSWGDPISENDTFGFNNDFIQFIPDKSSPNEALLWVNHEYLDRTFCSNWDGSSARGPQHKAEVDKEMYQVGGSFIKIKNEDGQWRLVGDHPLNRRVSGLTKIPFNWDEKIAGRDWGMGTLGNCSGGLTPWGNILTCEENYDGFYGERVYNENNEPLLDPSYWGWENVYPDNHTEHYGWVVEVNPETGEANKHIALGRCAHECAMLKELDDERVVVYTGDDGNDRCLYKFIGAEPGSLKKGMLHVAKVETGEWLPLDWENNPILKEKFSSQTEVMVRLREAAPLIGGTPLARPEDIEIDPVTGDVLIALTNNKPKGNYMGEIFKIVELDGYDGLSFKSETFLAGGEETGFACPDNMEFDLAGNLWFTSDISGSQIGDENYKSFGNNGLFFVPRAGKDAGKVIQVASAPVDAEFTGPCFSDDGKTLFLSVQHPGEESPSLEELTSHWPNGGNSVPKPSVICIQGEALNKIAEQSLS
jgi:secreted PhoX family phosphatase